ncbi:MAG TPA: phospholipase [Gammaproteobacteria bacterium]|nr:phospholipase [Gammaproteobacteria bacterium]
MRLGRKKRIVILVHGWSVRNTDSFGGLPERLKLEAARSPDLDLDVRQIWLSEYISFHNEVTIPDISRAFDAALQRECGDALKQGRRIACIAHSTGGPVVRAWLQQHCLGPRRRRPPLSHLIMLAPANFGCALVQLGLAKLSRLRAWFEGMEVGTGVLDWLELGSPQSCALNLQWLEEGAGLIGPKGLFPFVLAGQSHDPLLYDPVNGYTAELGSDGVVRAAAANLNFTHIRLRQQAPVADMKARFGFSAPELVSAPPRFSPAVPYALLPGRCHSDVRMGIMRSVPADGTPHPTVDALLQCLRVDSKADYARLFDAFQAQTAAVQEEERVEDRSALGPFDHQVIRDACSMLVFRVRDDQGNPVKDFDLQLTVGPGSNPNHLPPGFFLDRQLNHLDPGTVTYYVNHARLHGSPAIGYRGRELRPALQGAASLGVRVIPYPQEGFVHYLPASLKAEPAHLAAFVQPNQTTLVDVVLRRVVREGVYRLTRDASPENFTKQPPGAPVE